MNNSGFRIRVDDELRSRFIATCKAHDLTAAQVLREFMRLYIEQSDQGTQFDLFSSINQMNIDQSPNESKEK